MKKEDRKALLEMATMSSQLVRLQFCVDFAENCQKHGINNDEEVEEARQIVIDLQDQLAQVADMFLKSCLANAKFEDDSGDLFKMVDLYSERLKNPNRPAIISDFIDPEERVQIVNDQLDSVDDGSCEIVRDVRYIPEEMVREMLKSASEAVLYTQPICNVLQHALIVWKQSQ